MIRFLVPLLLLVGAVRADNDWLLTTADLGTQRVGLAGIDANGLLLSTPQSNPIPLPLDQFLSISAVGRTATSTSRWFVALADGQRIVGEPISTANEVLKWRSVLGETDIPLRSIVGINVLDARQAAPEDIITLGNGDQVRGVIVNISNEAVDIQSAAGEITPVALSSISSVSFAGSAAATSQPRTMRVRLLDGSIVAASSLALDNGTLRFVSPDSKPRDVSLDWVVAIEQINGPVVWLSTLSPTESVQTPYFGDGNAGQVQPRRDRQGLDHTIRTHSFSRLTFAIPEGMKVFRTQFCIDGDLPYADVTIRVRLDGAVAFERQNVRAGKPEPAAVIELGSAKSIELEVDYGENYDVQDRFNWMDPAFLRSAPATQPSR